MTTVTHRQIEEVLTGMPTSDGAGVKLTRVFGGQDLARFDPFLMLDEFGSEEAQDYIGGFPPHPHRGFETVTYMLEGLMEHRDHMGNVGRLGPGGVQWMTAGSGVIHSEMPQQEEGRMRGFQLWVNLPAVEKMQPAGYDDIPATDIPRFTVDGVAIKAIAGSVNVNGQQVTGRVIGPSTDPVYLDLVFEQDAALDFALADGYTSLVYVYEGSATVTGTDYRLDKGKLARLGREGVLGLAAAAGSRVLLISGKPIGEPIVHHGPFVMNTEEEIYTAIQQYQAGTLVAQQGR